MIAGSLFRIAVGAMPFLLPLMLQLSFGESPLQSGLVTFAAAAGALGMKPAAQPLLRRFGFRNVLVVNGVLASGFIIACAAFQPSWPSLVLDVILLVGGFFRSLQFTAYNTIAYGDIPRARMSAATSLYATIQQLTLTLGIVVGAAVLEIATRAVAPRDGAHSADYALAFIVVGGIAMLAVPFCARLHPSAGEELSGHHATHWNGKESGRFLKKAAQKLLLCRAWGIVADTAQTQSNKVFCYFLFTKSSPFASLPVSPSHHAAADHEIAKAFAVLPGLRVIGE